MLLLALIFLLSGADARNFNITYLSVPQVVTSGQADVEIECRYDANFTLLSWFKGPSEFFRYKPSAIPSTRSFPVLGIGRIEMINCGPTDCRLRLGALTEEATGLYRCDIERDVPPRQFETRTAYMQVYGHEIRRPLLEGLAEEFGEGDEMLAYCRTEPDTELRWYVNGREIVELRDSPTFKKTSTRLLFAGLPPTVTVQCAEFKHRRLIGSKEAKALWKTPARGFADETAQEQRSSASKCDVIKVLLPFYILIKMAVL